MTGAWISHPPGRSLVPASDNLSPPPSDILHPIIPFLGFVVSGFLFSMVTALGSEKSVSRFFIISKFTALRNSYTLGHRVASSKAHFVALPRSNTLIA